MEHARCPQCTHPAEITDRFTLDSTDGPLEHVKLVCTAGHWFTPFAEDVEMLSADAWQSYSAAA